MKIYIMRHGQTDSNIANILQGQKIDEPLNSEGKNQVGSLAKGIDKDFDIIFTSPLKRARESADIVSQEINVPVIEKKELVERDYGKLSEKNWEEAGVEAGIDHLTLKKKDWDQEYDYRPYGGESVEDVKNRFFSFINEIKNNYSDKKVLIVAHGGILRLAHFLLLEKKAEHPIENASIYEFEI